MEYLKIWILLKQYINTKNSHGKNELINKMNELEINMVLIAEKEIKKETP